MLKASSKMIDFNITTSVNQFIEDVAKIDEKVKKMSADREYLHALQKEDAKIQGFGIANQIDEKLHNTWTSDDKIQKEFRKVNRENAYSFVGKMHEITDSNTVFGDSRKRINYRILKHVTANFLNQALTLELDKTQAWKELKTEYDAINRQITKNPDKTPDEFDINNLNKAFKKLYNEMSKVYI